MAFNPKKSGVFFEEMSSFNLKDPDTGVEIESDGFPVKITMYGHSSKKHRNAVEKLLSKQAKRGKREATIEEKRQESLDFLVDITHSFENYEDDDGVLVTTPEQIRKVYADEEISFVRDQASEWAGQNTNFLKR